MASVYMRPSLSRSAPTLRGAGIYAGRWIAWARERVDRPDAEVLSRFHKVSTVETLPGARRSRAYIRAESVLFVCGASVGGWSQVFRGRRGGWRGIVRIFSSRKAPRLGEPGYGEVCLHCLRSEWESGRSR